LRRLIFMSSRRGHGQTCFNPKGDLTNREIKKYFR
jgi:hypothetical protein